MVDKSRLTAALDYLNYNSCMAQKKNPYQVAAVEEKIKETHKSVTYSTPHTQT